MGFDFGNIMGSMGTIISLTVAIPMLIVALVFMYLAMRAGGRARASRKWNTTTGRVIASSLEPRRSHSSTGGYSTSYYPQVMYEYEVNGQKYLNNRLNFGRDVGSGFTGIAQQWIAKYPVGAMIEVHYDPNDPAQAVLERTGGASSKIFWVVAIIILLITAVSVAFAVGVGSLVNQVTASVP
jgi:hypothetical protein